MTYPLSSTEKLVVYCNSMNPTGSITDVSEAWFHNKLAERTGVNVEWQFPVSGSNADQNLNLMIASDELPDVMIWNLGSRAQQLIEDGYLLPLNDVIAQWAPNLTDYLAEHPEFDKALRTDSGDMYAFPFLRESEWLLTYKGPIARKDMLDAVGLDIPTTIDDWTVALRAMKNEFGAYFTFNDSHTNIHGPWNAYGVIRDFYMEGDTIHYGPIEPQFKDALELMHGWYAEGLIDPDFTSLNDTTMKPKAVNDKVSMAYTVSSQFSGYVVGSAEVNPNAEWVGIPYPVLNEGDVQEFNHMSNMPEGKGAVITTQCKNVELAARFLDYGYSEEGIMFYNFGEEGTTYTMENGVPTFTALITEHPSGLGAATSIYTGAGDGTPTIQLINYWKSRNSAAAAEAVDIWNGGEKGNNMAAHRMPMLNPTTEENSEQSTLFNAIDTYADEMYYKFIIGEESLDNFDQYVDTIRNMGIDRVLELKNTQYQRYLNR